MHKEHGKNVTFSLTDLQDRCPECGSALKERTISLSGQPRTIVLTCPCIAAAKSAAEEAAALARRSAQRKDAAARYGDYLVKSGIMHENDRFSVLTDFSYAATTAHAPMIEAIGRTLGLIKAAADTDAVGVHGFALYGLMGRGKTFLTDCVINACLELGVRATRLESAKLKGEVLSAMSLNGEHGAPTPEQVLEKYTSIPVLVIDDLGKAQAKGSGGDELEFAQERLFSIVDRRTRSRRPTIVTSNYSPEDLANERWKGSQYGPQIVGRLTEGFGCDPSRWFLLTGRDLRRDPETQKRKDVLAARRMAAGK